MEKKGEKGGAHHQVGINNAQLPPIKNKTTRKSALCEVPEVSRRPAQKGGPWLAHDAATALILKPEKSGKGVSAMMPPELRQTDACNGGHKVGYIYIYIYIYI